MLNNASKVSPVPPPSPQRTNPLARLRPLLLITLALASLPIAIANTWILLGAIGHTTSRADDIPPNSAVIVFGTSPKLRNHQPNPFFEGRMDATAALFRAGKAGRIILSGDHRRPEYNEPLAMREALIRRGVPADAMEPDNEGIRTLLSLRNAKENFQLKEIITVTDDFHQPRCLFLAKHFGIRARGFSGPSVPLHLSFKTRLREIPSRFKAFMETLLGRTDIPKPTPHQTSGSASPVSRSRISRSYCSIASVRSSTSSRTL